MRMRLNDVLVLGAALLAAGQAQAGISYSYVTDQTSYSGAVGTTLSVNVYLLETLTGSSSSLITANSGLAAAGAGINVATGSTGSSTVKSFAENSSGFSVNGGNYINQNGGNNAEFQELIGVSVPGVGLGNGNGATSQEVYLGTLTVTVGAGTTKYDLSSLTNDTINGALGGPGSDTTVTKNPVDNLDASGATWTGADSASDTVFSVNGAAVPEPSSVILTGFAVAGLALGAYRRRAKTAATQLVAMA